MGGRFATRVRDESRGSERGRSQDGSARGSVLPTLSAMIKTEGTPGAEAILGAVARRPRTEPLRMRSGAGLSAARCFHSAWGHKDASTTPASRPDVEPIQWWRALNDRQLNALVARAVASDLDIEAAHLRIPSGVQVPAAALPFR
jgi:hypothetical protein